MAKSDNLRKAKDAKYDEFYTRYEDIDDELYYYTTDREDLKIKNQFKDKIVFCNCDDPEWSNFYRYFDQGFTRIGLKKLISTHYERDGNPSYALIKERVGDNIECRIKKLKGNGDFRSDECIEFLKECDIVCSNPPFSEMTTKGKKTGYMSLILKYNKKFLIIGDQNMVAYKEIFPLIKENKVWMGVNKRIPLFRVPDDYNKGTTTIIDGIKYAKMGKMNWYTNLDHYQRHEMLDVSDYYYGNEDKYPKYYNFDGIDVGAIDDIPCDYEGAMGVPITLIGDYNPDQFEILGVGNKISKNKKHIAYKTKDIICYEQDGKILWQTKYSVSERKIGNSLRLKDENGNPGDTPYNRIIVKLKNPKLKKEIS